MNIIKLKKKREILFLTCVLSSFFLAFLSWIDIQVLTNSLGFKPTVASEWAAFYLINVGLLGMAGLLSGLTLPNFLAVYSDEGIRWPSWAGYKLIKWRDISSVEDKYTFWRRRQIIVKTHNKKVVISPELFLAPDEVVAEIKRRVPAEIWK